MRVSFRFVADFSGKIPGSERKECGKNLLHDLEGTKAVAADMIAVLDGYKPEKLNYRAETLCLKKFICITVSANQSQPFRQTEKDAKIYSQQKSERSCEYDDYKRRKTGTAA